MSKRKLDDWLTAYSEYTYNSEPPDLFKIWSGISAIASVLKRKCYSEWESRLYPNMYIVLVGPSGCRKGTALRPVRSLLSELGIKFAAEAITREALIRELANSQVTDPNAITGEIAMHSSLTIFSEELTVFLGQNNWQLMSDLNNWFDCLDTWTYRTKNMGEDVIIGVWVNLIGATTPEFLMSALPQDAIGGGLSSRILFVYGDKKSRLCPISIPTEEEKALREDLSYDLDVISMLQGEFKYTEEFLSTYVDWYLETAKNPPFEDRNFLGYNERRATHLRKLAMIMSASRSDEMVMKSGDFTRALTLLEETEQFMPFAFTGRGRQKNSDILEAVLKLVCAKGAVSKKELLLRHYKDITARDLDEMLNTVATAGFVREVFKGNTSYIEWTKKET